MANLNFNKTIIGGRLTADPELKTTPGGNSVTTFSVAVNRKKDKDGNQITDFFNVTAWRQTAEFVCQYFRKASSIMITGRLQTRTWEDNNGSKHYTTEIVADEVFFVDAKSDGQQQPQPQQQSQQYPTYSGTAQSFEDVPNDDDLPF